MRMQTVARPYAMWRSIVKRVLLSFLFVLSALSFLGAQDITVFRPAVNPRDKKDVMVQAAARYKEETGGKVSFVISDWGNWQSKILSYQAAGEPIDVVFGGDSEFPKFYVKKYVQPIDGYVDMDKPYLNKNAMKTIYKFDGKHYLASQTTSAHNWMITYNKSLMEEEGIAEKDQPYALYQRGEWTWAKMRELAIKMTKDSSGSGKIDRWGFGTWMTHAFIYMNDTALTVDDGKGGFKLNFDDPKLLEALQFLADAKKEGWYMQDNSIVASGLPRRSVAMVLERVYFAAQMLPQTRDELAYVPLPVGPSNKNQRHMYECDGYGIGMGSTNQKWAGKFIDIALESWYKYDLSTRKDWPKEIFPIQAEMAKKQYFPNSSASPLDSIVSSFLGEIVWTGLDPATALAAWRGQAEILVAEANKPGEKPTRLPFKAWAIDFEKGGTKGLEVGPETKNVKISVVSDARAIKGKSLLVSCDYTKDGEYIDAVFSNPDQYGFVGWRDYRVSFDVKMLNPPADPETMVYFQIWGNKLDNWGWTTQKIEEAGKVYSVSTVVRNVHKNGKFAFKMGGRFAGDFVIDNIKVSER